MDEIESDTSDISDLCVTFDVESDFDEIIEQITVLAQSYDESIIRLQWIHEHLHQTKLDTLLDELHAESLQEIEETGQSSFGLRLIEKLKSIAPHQ